MTKQHFKMIRFIRLLFYHIYICYDKSEKGGKALTKFSTFAVFLVVLSLLVYGSYSLIYQCIDKNYIGTSKILYVFGWIVIGIIIAYYLYKEGFHDLDKFKDYHVKYYFYFFLIAGFAFALAFYSASINRERISKQREIQSKSIETGK